jgi:2-succinyl-5-enolpyruvyl-6-hydroxy-3-cyclohexene-1-carboxylate synthase
MEGNATVIQSLFAELDALGVQEFCIAAGARNAPLIAALLQRDQSKITIRHFFEERCAAFFALGRVMITSRPVAVLTTSGTAVGELLPAVMEAHYQALPVILVTADRPSKYRGSGAPQAVEQVGIFGTYLSRCVEMEATPESGFQLSDSVTDTPGPVQFNVCLDESFVQVSEPTKAAISIPQDSLAIRSIDQQNWDEFWTAEGEIIVLAGGIHPDDAPSAREFLLKLNAPVVAEATSNLGGDETLQSLLLLGGEKALAACTAKRVLRLGSVPSWRWWRDLEKREEVKVLSISRAPFRGVARSNGVSILPWEFLKQEPKSQSQRAPQSAAQSVEELLERFPNSETAWMRHLSRIIPDEASVFLGNSLPIREWNLSADKPKSGTMFFANRGANGIDGLISTWLGVGEEAASSWLIVGDLSTLYDLSGPWILPQLKKTKRRIVIINNGGGKIFSRVGWLRDLNDNARAMIENRHQLSFEHWARMWSMDYHLITSWQELSDDDSETAVWEIRPDEFETEAFWQAWK